jgi:cytochrome c biogenesis protein CcdA
LLALTVNEVLILSKVVESREQLKRAQEERTEEIIVTGDLAKKLKKAKKVALLGKVALAALAASLGAATLMAPVTGGISYAVAAPVAALTGVEIAAIIAASAVGIALVLAVFKEYDEVSYKDGELTLRRKKR